ASGVRAGAPLGRGAPGARLRLLLGVFSRVPRGGGEHPPAGPYLLAANHLSWVDPFLLLAWLPAGPRLHFLGRRSAVYNRRWKRWLLMFVGGVIPVESGQLRHLSEAVGGVLQRGGAVAIFPEGGVGPIEGVLQPLRGGVAHFAGDNGVPIVAAGPAGAHEPGGGRADTPPARGPGAAAGPAGGGRRRQ